MKKIFFVMFSVSFCRFTSSFISILIKGELSIVLFCYNFLVGNDLQGSMVVCSIVLHEGGNNIYNFKF